MKAEMLDVVQNNILNFWLKMEDNENGGFYGQMTVQKTILLSILLIMCMAEHTGNSTIKAIRLTQRNNSMP